MKEYWYVNVLGNSSETWEISVVKGTKYHGIRSFGWHTPLYKRPISSSPSESRNGGVCDHVWKDLLSLANDYCLALNLGILH